MSTPVAHATKIKTPVGFANVIAHNARLGIYDGKGELLEREKGYEHIPWITRTDRAHLNILEQMSKGAALALHRNTIRAAAAANKAAGFDWRKPQKNACAAIELNLSASPEWFEGKPEKVVKAYFNDLKEWAEKRYGKDNLLHWAVHYDETTPHAHATFIPIMQKLKDKEPDGLKYASGAFLGGPAGMSDMQTSVWKEVGEKYGLERSVEGSRARHTDQKEWLAEQHKKLKHMNKVLQKREEIAAKKEAELELKEAELELKEADLDKKAAKVGKKEKDLERNMKVFQAVGLKSNEDRIEAVKNNQATKLIIEPLSGNEKTILKSFVDVLKLMPKEKWQPYLQAAIDLSVSYIPKKEKKKSLDNENSKGR